jgi:hypothetical protein
MNQGLGDDISLKKSANNFTFARTSSSLKPLPEPSHLLIQWVFLSQTLVNLPGFAAFVLAQQRQDKVQARGLVPGVAGQGLAQGILGPDKVSLL